MSVEMKW